MPANADEQVAGLRKPRLKKRLLVALTKAIVRPEDLPPFVAAHLDYMSQLESAGKLFASGPCVQEGVLFGDGLTSFKPGRSRPQHASIGNFQLDGPDVV